MSHLFQTYARWDITPERAQGSWLTGHNGKRYLDFTAGIGVLNLGHRPREVEQAIQDQLGLYWHTSNLFQQPLQENLADVLSFYSGLDCAFFCNSGAEANEAAIKLAKKATGRKKILSCLQSFHGRTYATMGATGQEKVRTGYGPMLDAFDYVAFNDCEDLLRKADNDTAAILIEIIQGEGGIHCADSTFIQTVKDAAKAVGALIIIDEVQTGIGRTGKPFAFQHYDLSPDIITVAKGLANGLPIGAMLGKKELAPYFSAGSHGSTFGGNPISVAAAQSVLNIALQDDFLMEVEKKGKWLLNALDASMKECGDVIEIRGLGLMVGIEMVYEVKDVLLDLQKEGLLVLNAGPNVIRLLPPLNVSESELEYAVTIMAERLNGG
ncbi:acetylornithine transaminase [Bacillus testis]|uniref:acetylornithine transaminase n=1 Tax=Bacillus testis TaxID=1622072 RepID=UPI00067F5155|nr:acetylornithine transaminase [Bacillus testis]